MDTVPEAVVLGPTKPGKLFSVVVVNTTDKRPTVRQLTSKFCRGLERITHSGQSEALFSLAVSYLPVGIGACR